ncbi:MAG: regulatory iron-sulfur-containing complex subunit RicT [Chloroflexota bacterium]
MSSRSTWSGERWLTMDPHIVGIRFQKIGKVYHFDASACCDLQVGDFAVVDTSRGRQLGEVIQVVEHPSPPPEGGGWKPIQRKATPRDLVLRQIWQQKELEATINCRARLAEMGIPGVKIAAAEFTFDGERLSFLYNTEAEGKVDLRKLRTAMQRSYPRTQVEMRQIGPRDVAKMLGGMGACGLETRCCSMFLTDFSPISIKMAKEQGISLTPSEITGMCGRLRCCLVYEYELYAQARKQLPRRNKRVGTPQGEGKVLDVYPLTETVVVELLNGARQEFPHSEIQPWEEYEALRKKAQQPCDKHPEGGCDCGKAALAGQAPAAGPAPSAGQDQSDRPPEAPRSSQYGRRRFKKPRRKNT